MLMSMKITHLLLLAVIIIVSACQQEHARVVVSHQLLYLDRTDASELFVVDTVAYNDYTIAYTDKIHKINSDIDAGVYQEQIITDRTYYLGQDSINVSFTNYCTNWNGLDSLETLFLFPNGTFGLISIDTYSPGTNGACGGSNYVQMSVFEYNKAGKLKKLTSIEFDGCLGELILDKKTLGGELFIDKVYWSQDKQSLIFEKSNGPTRDGFLTYDIVKQEWIF